MDGLLYSSPFLTNSPADLLSGVVNRCSQGQVKGEETRGCCNDISHESTYPVDEDKLGQAGVGVLHPAEGVHHLPTVEFLHQLLQASLCRVTGRLRGSLHPCPPVLAPPASESFWDPSLKSDSKDEWAAQRQTARLAPIRSWANLQLHKIVSKHVNEHKITRLLGPSPTQLTQQSLWDSVKCVSGKHVRCPHHLPVFFLTHNSLFLFLKIASLRLRRKS